MHYKTIETIRKIHAVLLWLIVKLTSRNICKALDGRTILSIARTVTSHVPVSTIVEGV